MLGQFMQADNDYSNFGRIGSAVVTANSPQTIHMTIPTVKSHSSLQKSKFATATNLTNEDKLEVKPDNHVKRETLKPKIIGLQAVK